MKEFNRRRIGGRRKAGVSSVIAGVGIICATTSISAIAQDAQGDVIRLTAGLGVTRDSNILRVNDDADLGGESRGDTYLRGSLGIGFDRLISQQRLQMDAEVDGYKYNEYDEFDNLGYNAGVNYDWVIPSRWAAGRAVPSALPNQSTTAKPGRVRGGWLPPPSSTSARW